MEYIQQTGTVANIISNHNESNNFRTITIILLGFFTIFSTLINIVLLIAILSSRKLRSVQLFVLFCNLALLNILNIISGIFTSLLIIIRHYSFANMTLCRWEIVIEEFINVELLMSIMLIAIERAIALFFPNRQIFKNSQTLIFISILWIISICLAIPALTHNIPVKFSESQYICNISSKVPILYPIVRILMYGSCLIIVLICLAALLSHSVQQRSKQLLPMKFGKNSKFIRYSPEIYNSLSFSKLILFLITLFILFNGPFIIFNLFMQIRNSNELLMNENIFVIQRDIHTVLNWLRFVFPLASPLLIYAVCGEIWLNIQQCLFCCE